MNFDRSFSIMNSLIHKFEEKSIFFTNKPIISLLILGVISLLVRWLFFEPEIPIRQDANAYFWYAMDMSILNYFPYSIHANDGWPIVLSVIFSIFNFDNYLDYTVIQRQTTIVISVLTIIPIYYFSRKFFQPSYSLIVAALFVFEPHIIQNSFLGLTEPLYIFLGISSLSLFLSENKKLFYCSFAIVALATLVRGEGIVLFLILSILFFIFNKRSKKTIVKFFIAISIFVIIFGLMTLTKVEINGSFEGTSANNIIDWTQSSIINQEGYLHGDIYKGIETLIKRLAQSMIPYFVFFFPFGVFLVLRDKKKNKLLIIISLLVYLIVAVRMFSVVYDLRLILILYPVFAVVSVYTIRHLTENLELKRIVLFLMVCSCVILSGYFLYSNSNLEYEKEVVMFAEYMVNNVKVSNNFYPESGYIYGVWASSNLEFPVLSSLADYNGPELLDYVKNSYEYIEQNAESVEEYIILAREQGLSHLVVDGNDKRSSYFNDLYFNEKKYPYLIIEFDSSKEGYRFYNVKVFKIDYEYFDSIEKTITA